MDIAFVYAFSDPWQLNVVCVWVLGMGKEKGKNLSKSWEASACGCLVYTCNTLCVVFCAELCDSDI